METAEDHNAPSPNSLAMRTARWVSILGHPFVTVSLMVGAGATRLRGAGEGLHATLIVVCLALVPIAILMFVQVRRKAWENVDASNVKDRPMLYLIGTAGLVALLVYNYVIRPQSPLSRGVVGTLVMLLVCAAATRWIKVSLHLAFAALAATTLLVLHSAIGLFIAVLLPLLAWSRIKLTRHRPLELALGFVIGAITGLVIHFA